LKRSSNKILTTHVGSLPSLQSTTASLLATTRIWQVTLPRVSQRLQRYAKRVGRENVIAGTDCGFGGRSHPQIAWAKLRSLVEGAALASKALGFTAG
jgi:hypothetical protein